MINKLGTAVMKQAKSKVTQINTPYVRAQEKQKQVNHSYRYRVHMRRFKIITTVFAVLLLFFGVQIWTSKRQLASVNKDINSAHTELHKKQATNRSLKKQVKRLHNPEYLQAIMREKYNYAKDGETVYQFVK